MEHIIFPRQVNLTARFLSLAIATTVLMAAEPAELRAIRSYKPAAIKNACAIEATVFTGWLRERFPQYPARVIHIPVESIGMHSVALLLINRSAYVWDMDRGLLDLEVKADSVNDVALVERARRLFAYLINAHVRATLLSSVSRYGQSLPKLLEKTSPPRNVSLYRWVYDRLAPIVTEPALIQYRGREYVVFMSESSLHVFSEEKGTVVGRLLRREDKLAGLREILSECFGGDGNFQIVTGTV